MKEEMRAEDSGILLGRAHTLKRNQSLLFNDPETVWYVANGSLEVQNTRFQEDIPIGGRRHLFQILSRNAVFGSKPDKTSGWQGWMGIVPTETVVREISLADFVSHLLTGDGDCRAIIGTWVAEIGAYMGYGNEPPTSLIRLPESGDYEFGMEETLAAPADEFFWVRVRSGELALFGRDDLKVGPEDGCLLVGGDLWLKVMSDVVEITVSSMPDADSGAALKRGFSSLHGLFNLFLERLSEEEEEAELARRQTSEELQKLAAEAAIQNLSSVLDPVERFPLRQTPLLTAVSVVGQVIGAEIKPPGTSEDMTRINDPVEPIARASRLRYRRVIFGPEWWKLDSGPLLAYLGEERKPVALLPDGNSYSMVDPEKRYREPLTPELRQEINADAYTLYRPLPDKISGIGDLTRFTVRGKVRDMLFILLMALFTTLLGMLTPRITGSLVDKAIPAADHPFLYQLAAILFVAAFASAVFMFVQVMTTVRTTIQTEESAQSALWDRLLKLSPRFFRRYSSGDLQSRVNAVSEVSRELSTATLRPLFSGVMALLNWLLLWYYSWDLAKLAIYIGLVVLIIVVVIGYFVRRLSRVLYNVEGEYQGLVIQLIGGVGKIRVAGSEERAFNHWLRKYTQQLKLVLKIQRWKDVMTMINNVLVPIATAFLFWKAIDITIDLPIGDEDRISIGDFIAFNTAFILYLTGWSDLSSGLVEVFDSAAKIHRIIPLLEEDPEVPEEAADPGRLAGNIAMDKVSFRYTEDGPLIIDEVSFEVHPGEYVAFVGPSGSGKSTILRLLLGFEVPEYGRVLYDGQDVAGLDVLAVRRQLGTVLQEGRLTAASIIDNISNNARVTHAEVWDAIADAGMTEDIELMPMGLHTMISEGGGNLSGGQRQRLLIARSLAIRPKIVMFDEATSALDNKTQGIVSESLDRRKVTRIVIAHRLSTIQQADRIYVVDKGRVMQYGSFEELSSSPGMFKDLMARQMV